MPDIRLNGILTPPINSVQPVINRNADSAQENFSDILNNKIAESDSIKFSKHAQTRLESRNISLGQDDLSKLNDAVVRAAEKGVQDSLILMNQLAFIVNIPDRTVVTAMPVNEAGNVFTNIDGAVLV